MVKKSIIKRQSAGMKLSSDNLVPQRLNTENLIYAWFVGLIDGNGYFSIIKNGDYLKYTFGIELHIRDIQLLYKIKSLLGVGQISIISNKNTVYFKIINKYHLINIIIPIFDKYSLLTMKQYDYLKFKKMLLENIIYYKDLDKYDKPNINLYNIEDIINKNYFSSWLIGFIEAKGCFSYYKPTKNSKMVISFDISQSYDEIIILAIIKYLSFTSNMTVYNNNYKIKVSGTRSIENVIKFIHKTPVKFLGYKKLQYLLWIKEIRKIDTYTKKFKIPNKY